MALFGQSTVTLEIFMKSGNVIRLDRVLEYKIKNTGDNIIYFSITQKNQGRKLLTNTLSLSQIEAVVCVG